MTKTHRRRELIASVKEPSQKEIAKYYLQLLDPGQIRGVTLAHVLILLDLLGVLPLLAEPFHTSFFWIGIVPAAIVNVWALLYVIAPYRFEKSFNLFLGVYGLVNSFVYFLAIQKILYAHIGVISPLYIIVGGILLAALLILANVMHRKALYSGKYVRLHKGKQKTNLSPILKASGLGYIVSQAVLVFVTDAGVKSLLFVCALALLSLYTVFCTISLHRYVFMRKHEREVNELHPHMGMPKKERKFS